MFTVYLVIGTEQSFLGQFAALADAQSFVNSEAQGSVYSITYTDPNSQEITVIQ